MKTKDLIIMTFPTGSEASDEVRTAGLYLFAKHVRKHILTPRDPSAANKSNDEVLAAAAAPSTDAVAQRAWLIEIANTEATEVADKLIEGKHYWILHKTHALPAGRFDPDTGVYLVAHNEWAVTQVFGYFHLALNTRLPDITDLAAKYQTAAERGARGVANVVSLLGINNIRKLCMAACTMATPVYQKGFLATLVGALAEQGLRPLVAGWDIPLTVQKDGSKVAQGAAYSGPLKPLRAKHKYIYTFRQASVTVKGRTAKVEANREGKISEALQDFAKKQLKVSDATKRPLFEQALHSRHATTAQERKNTTINFDFAFTDRLSYEQSGWSDENR